MVLLNYVVLLYILADLVNITCANSEETDDEDLWANLLNLRSDESNTEDPQNIQDTNFDDGDEDDDDFRNKRSLERRSRFLFDLFPTYVACNFRVQAGFSCNSCTTTMFCLPNNLGKVESCRGIFRYCNNGHCSIFQSESCGGGGETTTTVSGTSTSSSSSTYSSSSSSSSSSTSTTAAA